MSSIVQALMLLALVLIAISIQQVRDEIRAVRQPQASICQSMGCKP